MEGGEAGVVAVTKVFAIRVRLDDRVRYITDGEKTSLASSITYISNPEKTEQFFFTSALNCSSVDTALSEMMETEGYLPGMIIAVPVGFVNVVQAKDLILAAEVPSIVARGRKGGSNVAAAIVNALMYQLTRK